MRCVRAGSASVVALRQVWTDWLPTETLDPGELKKAKEQLEKALGPVGALPLYPPHSLHIKHSRNACEVSLLCSTSLYFIIICEVSLLFSALCTFRTSRIMYCFICKFLQGWAEEEGARSGPGAQAAAEARLQVRHHRAGDRGRHALAGQGDRAHDHHDR